MVSWKVSRTRIVGLHLLDLEGRTDSEPKHRAEPYSLFREMAAAGETASFDSPLRSKKDTAPTSLFRELAVYAAYAAKVCRSPPSAA